MRSHVLLIGGFFFITVNLYLSGHLLLYSQKAVIGMHIQLMHGQVSKSAASGIM